MDKMINLGSIEFFINAAPGTNWIPPTDYDELSSKLENEFINKFSKSKVSEYIKITSVKKTHGCIIEEFSFHIYSAILAGCIIKYPDLRKGLLQIANDFHNTYLYVKDKVTEHKVILTKTDIKELENLRMEDEE